MKQWTVRSLRDDRKLGVVVAEWALQATEVASSHGHRGFYVEPTKEVDPSFSELLQLAALATADELAAEFAPKIAAVRPRRAKHAWSPVHGFPVPEPDKPARRRPAASREVIEDSGL